MEDLKISKVVNYLRVPMKLFKYIKKNHKKAEKLFKTYLDCGIIVKAERPHWKDGSCHNLEWLSNELGNMMNLLDNVTVIKDREIIINSYIKLFSNICGGCDSCETRIHNQNELISAVNSFFSSKTNKIPVNELSYLYYLRLHFFEGNAHNDIINPFGIIHEGNFSERNVNYSEWHGFVSRFTFLPSNEQYSEQQLKIICYSITTFNFLFLYDLLNGTVFGAPWDSRYTIDPFKNFNSQVPDIKNISFDDFYNIVKGIRKLYEIDIPPYPTDRSWNFKMTAIRNDLNQHKFGNSSHQDKEFLKMYQEIGEVCYGTLTDLINHIERMRFSSRIPFIFKDNNLMKLYKQLRKMNPEPKGLKSNYSIKQACLNIATKKNPYRYTTVQSALKYYIEFHPDYKSEDGNSTYGNIEKLIVNSSESNMKKFQDKVIDYIKGVQL